MLIGRVNAHHKSKLIQFVRQPNQIFPAWEGIEIRAVPPRLTFDTTTKISTAMNVTVRETLKTING